jgi:hypothetical protein
LKNGKQPTDKQQLMDISTQNEDTRFLELLQKWQSGDFTRADEQEMNALAASDAFRREALEGILDFPTHDQATAILSLRRKIAGKSPRHRVLFHQSWRLQRHLP